MATVKDNPQRPGKAIAQWLHEGTGGVFLLDEEGTFWKRDCWVAPWWVCRKDYSLDAADRHVRLCPGYRQMEALRDCKVRADKTRRYTDDTPGIRRYAVERGQGGPCLRYVGW